MNKNKKAGTAHESYIVNIFKDKGMQAKRIAEGGSYDEGDVEVIINDTKWVIEAKAKSSLNIQATLHKARVKAEGVNKIKTPVAIIWKRLVRVDGYKVRQPVANERIIICLSLDDFFSLINSKDNNSNAE